MIRRSNFIPTRSTMTVLVAATLLLGAAACEADDIYPAGTPTGAGTVASEVAPWQGNESAVATGATTSIGFRVTDISDRPVSGVTITMSTSSGTLATTTGTSDANGIVNAQFTTSTVAQPDTITATFDGVTNPAQLILAAVAQQ